MDKSRFVPFYFIFLGLVSLIGSFRYWTDDQFILAVIGTVLSVALILSALGYIKNVNSLLWFSIVIVSAYSLYAIGTGIWLFWTVKSITNFFLLLWVSILVLINVYVIYRLRERIWYLS